MAQPGQAHSFIRLVRNAYPSFWCCNHIRAADYVALQCYLGFLMDDFHMVFSMRQWTLAVPRINIQHQHLGFLHLLMRVVPGLLSANKVALLSALRGAFSSPPDIIAPTEQKTIQTATTRFHQLHNTSNCVQPLNASPISCVQSFYSKLALCACELGEPLL